ncbi:hypothetical protein HNQ68_000317 [Pseudochrobactrum saccharolyticum]|uniref:Uncharacterized protein n=1 Tax=Pseudochrobactrum saccharolyticum TaxID=354352 RepID=A0A7W8ELV0_9HYPH|nr:hypothetical protein [Pseudochrobactrum saccharolyticum]
MDRLPDPDLKIEPRLAGRITPASRVLFMAQ